MSHNKQQAQNYINNIMTSTANYNSMSSPPRATGKDKCAVLLSLALIIFFVDLLIYSLTPEETRTKRMLKADERAWEGEFESELVSQTWRSEGNISNGFLKASTARYTNMSKPHVFAMIYPKWIWWTWYPVYNIYDITEAAEYDYNNLELLYMVREGDGTYEQELQEHNGAGVMSIKRPIVSLTSTYNIREENTNVM